jgi:hypothetical protein
VRRVLLVRATAEHDSGADLQGKHATAVPLLIQPSGAIARDSWDIMTSVAGFPYAPASPTPRVGCHASCVDDFGML